MSNFYIHPCDIRATRNEKLDYLKSNTIDKIEFQHLIPDKKNNWINLSDNDFDELLPLIDKDVKTGKSGKALFELFSLGVASHRDIWVYDFSKKNLVDKIRFFINTYQKTLEDDKYIAREKIAWDRELNNYLRRKIQKEFENEKVISSLFRPFAKQYFYFDKHLNGMLYQFSNIYSTQKSNLIIAVNREGNSKPFHCIATDLTVDLHTTGDSQCLPLYRFNEKKERIENITDWGLTMFRERYEKKTNKKFVDERGKVDYYTKTKGFKISKEDIFHYTYAVLHNPAYRKKYELNLKREFPRIPFYDDFFKWAAWGKELMDLHINYENAKPFPLKENSYTVKAEAKRQKEIFAKVEEVAPLYGKQAKIKVKLKADKAAGIIEIDELTFLSGVPKEAYEYKLGNRSAIEWVLDQYKEKKPSDPTIAEKFNTYQFSDYKTHVIDLLRRVCTVSLETVGIVGEMEK